MPDPAVTTSVSPAGLTDQPDWAQISHEVLCPLCEYNLRGLTQPRCPECGYHFTWDEVLTAARSDHPYLFEHHPRHNAWSFWKTTLGAWRPRAFWSLLHPTQRSHPNRLLLFWVAGLPLLVLAFAMQYCGAAAADTLVLQRERDHLRQEISRNPKSYSWITSSSAWSTTQQYIDARYPPRTFLEFLAGRSNFGPGFYAPIIKFNNPLIPMLWSPASLLALLIFQISMRRAKIKTSHVLRCVIYSFDAGLWLGVCLLASAMLCLCTQTQWIDSFMLLIRDVAVVVGTWRLCAAYRYYLRFDHPWATAIVSQVLVMLGYWAIMSALSPMLAYQHLRTHPILQWLLS